jgi:predicted GNAT family acetyltransferase
MSHIVHKQGVRRFEWAVEGAVAFVEYEVYKPNVFALTHTLVPDAHKGKGVASQLIKRVFDWCKKHRVEIVPVCPFIVTFIERHPE